MRSLRGLDKQQKHSLLLYLTPINCNHLPIGWNCAHPFFRRESEVGMRKEKDYFKFPIYWSDFFMNLSDKQAGRLLKSVLKYAFYGEYPDFSKFNKEQKGAWYIMKRDLDFQKEHARAYRYQEDYQDDAITIRGSKPYANWRKSVFDRDGYTCQVCGQVGGRLNAHHIKRFADYPDLRLEIANGITLCESCHKKVHRHEIDIVIFED